MALTAYKKISGELKSCGFDVVRANGMNAQTTLTTWDDMNACGMSKGKVSDAYQKEFGKKPDEVHLNDDFCKKYGWFSYNLLGQTTYTNVSIIPKADITGERFLENDTSDSITSTVELSRTLSNSATASVTSASSVSVGSTITIGAPDLGIGGQFSQNFSVSNEVGSTSTQSAEVTITDTVSVVVPPGAKYRVYLQVTLETRSEEWEIPVTIDPRGWTGAQFPHKVQGHYYWALVHSAEFSPPFQSKIKGKLDCAYSSSGKIVVEEVQGKDQF